MKGSRENHTPKPGRVSESLPKAESDHRGNYLLVINWKLIGSISLSGSNYLSPNKGSGDSD